MSNVVKLESRRTAEAFAPESEPLALPRPELADNELEELRRVSSSPDHARVVTAPPASPWRALYRFSRASFRGAILALYLLLRATFRYLVRHPFHAALTTLLVTLLALMIVTGSEIHTQMILGKISDQSVDHIITGSRFTRTHNALEVERNGVRDFLRVGAPEWMQRESVRAILFHARKAGLPIEDQAVLLAIADIESGFNPMARAPTTTACGLFQFVKRTGEMFNLSQAECMNPWLNARAGVAHYLYNLERRVSPQTAQLQGAERVFRLFELSYYLHHDGPESNNPSADVKATILNGTQFLFKSYHALKLESESHFEAPTFTQKFESNLLRFLDRIREFFVSTFATSVQAEAPAHAVPTAGEETVAEPR